MSSFFLVKDLMLNLFWMNNSCEYLNLSLQILRMLILNEHMQILLIATPHTQINLS